MSNLKEKFIQLILNEDINGFNSERETEEFALLEIQETLLSGFNLTGINLSNTDLTGSDFSESNLESADLTNSNLTSVNFSGANMQYCNFNHSNLSGANLTRAIITEADFTESNLSGADLRETDLTDSDLSLSLNLDQSKFDKFTKWPDEHNLPEEFDTHYDTSLPGFEDEDDENIFDGELEDN